MRLHSIYRFIKSYESYTSLRYCTILCYAALCYTVRYCTILCYAALCYTVLCYTVLYCTILCYAALCYTVLCYIVLYCTVLYCAALYYTVIHCSAIHRTVLYCTVLYCTVPYCILMYNTVLYVTVLDVRNFTNGGRILSLSLQSSSHLFFFTPIYQCFPVSLCSLYSYHLHLSGVLSHPVYQVPLSSLMVIYMTTRMMYLTRPDSGLYRLF